MRRCLVLASIIFAAQYLIFGGCGDEACSYGTAVLLVPAFYYRPRPIAAYSDPAAKYEAQQLNRANTPQIGPLQLHETEPAAHEAVS